ncbi:glutamate--cysteine ligase regulatory subunit [Stomoxys calcitrans]|uniref:GCS light chain n=1 Tax=Stomoxys calcitrans TaxID=35570 RepID=A0A1I8QAS4_STOCA|nr:glutamate--cysteine ligase regulatory subunit [Stomoxys calcitrans]
MLTEIAKNPKSEKVLISTGNILNVDNGTPLRTTAEELLDSLKLCNECQAAAAAVEGKDDPYSLAERGDNEVQVLRAQKELQEKILENQRNEISIGAKLFINKASGVGVQEAVKALMAILKVDYVDNLVVAYHPQDSVAMDMNSLKNLWNVLQEFAEKKQICQLGIADLDSATLQQLCAEARIQPTIAQINLANCCVVPPELKEYCTQHDIQLLTHGDPEILIADDDFIIPHYTVDWSMRYQVHLRCRGVLTARGYILQATRKSATALHQ